MSKNNGRGTYRDGDTTSRTAVIAASPFPKRKDSMLSGIPSIFVRRLTTQSFQRITHLFTYIAYTETVPEKPLGLS